jgi:hypothetical protein
MLFLQMSDVLFLQASRAVLTGVGLAPAFHTTQLNNL